jgi:AraC-like DNA-binding protein
MQTDLSSCVDWREQPLEDPRPGQRVFSRMRTGLAWRFDERRCGVQARSFGSDPRRMSEALSEWFATLPSGPLELLVDWRAIRLGRSEEELDALHRAIDKGLEAARGRLLRLVAVVPHDTSRLWWHGLLAVAELGCPFRVVHELAQGCEVLGLPRGFEAELAALGGERRASVVADVEDVLASMLEADTNLVSRALAMSTRSLQRALELEGQTFLAVRDRLRLAAAHSCLRRGDKVEAVASQVGFASTSHFVRWFRLRSGVTPSDYRKVSATSG